MTREEINKFFLEKISYFYENYFNFREFFDSSIDEEADRWKIYDIWESFRDEMEEDGLGYCASGQTRGTIVLRNSDYVVKFNKDETHNYNKAELYHYEDSFAEGVESAFAECWLLPKIVSPYEISKLRNRIDLLSSNNKKNEKIIAKLKRKLESLERLATLDSKDILIMRRADVDEDKFYVDGIDSFKDSEEAIECVDDLRDDKGEEPSDFEVEEAISEAFSNYDEEDQAFYTFANHYGYNFADDLRCYWCDFGDIHSGNVGFLPSGTPVLIDYAGFGTV